MNEQLWEGEESGREIRGVSALGNQQIALGNVFTCELYKERGESP